MKNIIKILLGALRLKVSRIPKKRTNWDLKIGQFIIKMSPKGNLYDQYINNENYSREIGTLASIISGKYPNFKMIDIGANVGDTAAVVKNVLPNVPIICIEGDNESHEYLLENTAQFNNVHNYKYYLGEKTEIANAKMDKVGWNNTIQFDEESSNPISIVTLDDFLLNENIKDTQNIKFIKIDTEGFDNKIIRGSKKHLNASKPILFFEYNTQNHKLNNENGLDIFTFLEHQGYNKIIFLDSNGKYLLNVGITDFEIISDLHHYSLKYNDLYYDVCAFHKEDEDLFRAFVQTKRYN
jgi:FkbM family methyltransferase